MHPQDPQGARIPMTHSGSRSLATRALLLHRCNGGIKLATVIAIDVWSVTAELRAGIVPSDLPALTTPLLRRFRKVAADFGSCLMRRSFVP